MATSTDGAIEVLALSKGTLAKIDIIDMKVRVVDALGDEHEKVLYCLGVNRVHRDDE